LARKNWFSVVLSAAVVPVFDGPTAGVKKIARVTDKMFIAVPFD
jgi:hypothetical protein